MRESEAERRGLEPRLALRSVAVSGIEPEVMGYAPAFAIPKALEQGGLTLADMDLVELNEAFAAQAVAVVREWRSTRRRQRLRWRDRARAPRGATARS